MVFGNMGETSATGVAFTRNPSTGEARLYGEFLINAQGEDVVAGIRTPQSLTKAGREEMGETALSMEEAMPEVFAQFVDLDGTPGYYSYLITHKDSGITSLDQVLKNGKDYSFGIGDPSSTSGTLVPTYYVFSMNNLDPRTHFKVMRSANHEGNFLAVLNKQVQIATSNSEMTEKVKEKNPERMEQIRILWTSPLIPRDPLVWRKDLPADIKKKVQDFVVGYGKDAREKEILKNMYRLAGFKASTDAQLLPIRQLELFKDRRKFEGDANMSESDRKARLADIDAKAMLEAESRDRAFGELGVPCIQNGKPRHRKQSIDCGVVDGGVSEHQFVQRRVIAQRSHELGRDLRAAQVEANEARHRCAHRERRGASAAAREREVGDPWLQRRDQRSDGRVIHRCRDRGKVDAQIVGVRRDASRVDLLAVQLRNRSVRLRRPWRGGRSCCRRGLFCLLGAWRFRGLLDLLRWRGRCVAWLEVRALLDPCAQQFDLVCRRLLLVARRHMRIVFERQREALVERTLRGLALREDGAGVAALLDCLLRVQCKLALRLRLAVARPAVALQHGLHVFAERDLLRFLWLYFGRCLLHWLRLAWCSRQRDGRRFVDGREQRTRIVRRSFRRRRHGRVGLRRDRLRILSRRCLRRLGRRFVLRRCGRLWRIRRRIRRRGCCGLLLERLQQPFLSMRDLAAEVASAHQRDELDDEHQPERAAVLHRGKARGDEPERSCADAEPAMQLDGVAGIALATEDPATACCERAAECCHPGQGRERRSVGRLADQRAAKLERDDAKPQADRHVEQERMQPTQQLHERVLVHQRRIPFTTLPATSVSRKSRPSWR
jgi:hypothetical protein